MNKVFHFWAAMVLPFFYMQVWGATQIVLSISGNQAEINQLQHLKVELEKFKNGFYEPIGTALFQNGKATFIIDEKQATFCKLKVNGIGEASIIVSPEEKTIFLASSLQNFKYGDYVFFSSKENQCLLKVKAAETELARNYFELLPRIKNEVKHTLASKLDSALMAAQENYNTKLNNIANDYENSYCSSFVVPNLKAPVKSDVSQPLDSFFLLHALDSLQFSNEKILSLPNFFDMLKGYQKNFVPNTIEGNKTIIDVIFKREKIDAKVQQFLLNYYLQKFMAERKPELVSYLLEVNKHIPFDTTSADGLLAVSIKKLLPGNTAFDAALESENDTAIKISEAFKNADYGVILFYNHECEHCLELIPTLQKAVANSTKKIAVYAINTHHEKQSWLNFVRERKLPFTNVFLNKEMGGTLATKYAILSIPIVVITDKNLKIITRFGTPEMLLQLP
jgi:thiol-disulfide isomerase/thioredoxin